MKKTSETIVFFGNERLATSVTTDVPTLRALITAGYNVVAIVSHNEQGYSRNIRTLEIESVAKDHNIPFYLPARLSDMRTRLAEYGADVGVLVAYGKIVPRAIIDIFPRGIVNIHPSLLPLHRGPTPIEAAILGGDRKTGVSIMQLVKDMDAGPLFGQREVLLSGKEGKQELAELLSHEGKELLLSLLPGILDGSVRPLSQDSAGATYDKLLSRRDGILDWQKPASRLEREIRAFSGWPKSRTKLAGKEIVVTKAHVVKTDCTPGQFIIRYKSLSIGTKHNALGMDLLVPAGKKEMTATAFLAGYGKAL